jgi:hypothetical protein
MKITQEIMGAHVVSDFIMDNFDKLPENIRNETLVVVADKIAPYNSS